MPYPKPKASCRLRGMSLRPWNALSAGSCGNSNASCSSGTLQSAMSSMSCCWSICGLYIVAFPFPIMRYTDDDPLLCVVLVQLGFRCYKGGYWPYTYEGCRVLSFLLRSDHAVLQVHHLSSTSNQLLQLTQFQTSL